jgi:hypothetical protein
MKLFDCYDYTECAISACSYAKIRDAFVAYFIVELSTKIHFDLPTLRNVSINRAIQEQGPD